MLNRIHVFGAAGSGTSTLGRHLASAIGGSHLDTDSYYWLKSEPPFTQKRAPSDRISLIEHDVQGKARWVLSGSICSWGDPLLHRFTLAVFLYLDPAIRMARLAERERARYGDRILPGEDMHEQHVQFMAWASSYDTAKAPVRSFDLHERWLAGLKCPVIRMDSGHSVDDLCNEVLRRADTDK